MTLGLRLASRRHFLTCLSVIGTCVALAGCGDAGGRTTAPNQAQITGSLKNGPKNLAVDTLVTFESSEKSASARGKVDALGKFNLTAADPAVGIPAGSYTVVIAPPSGPSEKVGTDAYKNMMMKGGATAAPKPASEVPEKFQSAVTSTLKLNVAAGPNNYDIDLATVP